MTFFRFAVRSNAKQKKGVRWNMSCIRIQTMELHNGPKIKFLQQYRTKRQKPWPYIRKNLKKKPRNNSKIPFCKMYYFDKLSKKYWHCLQILTLRIAGMSTKNNNIMRIRQSKKKMRKPRKLEITHTFEIESK